MSTRITPNDREVIAAVDSVSGRPVYPTATNNILNVNATFSASSISLQDGVDSTIKGTILKLTDSNPLTVAITDGNGDQITSFGGGTQYTDGGVPPTHPVAPTLVWSDGSNWQTVSTAKPLPVTASVSISGVATAANQTNKSQITQIADGSGNVIGSTSNALDINIKSGNPTSITANAGTNLNTSLLALESGGNLATVASTVSSSKVNVNISSGNPTTMAVTQGTAANLNATVVGTGTFATQSTLQSGSNAVGFVGTSPNTINVGQQTVNTTAVQLSATATVPTNGILVQAISTNGASIFIGGSGVSTSNGWELSPGQAIAFTCTLNTIYIISAASTTDKVCYQVV